MEELIFYGDDIKIGRFPEDTRLFYANPPENPALDPIKAIQNALDHPVGAEPLEKQLNSRSRVTIAFDDLCLPIPLMQKDVRGLIIWELLDRLERIGISNDQIRLICANGLHRKWTLKELATVLGKKVIRKLGPDRIECHDATIGDRLIDLGTDASDREIEINRAVDESDITIYVNVNFTSMNGGWKSILVGLGSWRSIRHHHTPKEWNGVDSIMDPAHSPMHQALKEMGGRVKKKYNIFQIETVLNNQVWPPLIEGLLSPFIKKHRGDFNKRLLKVAFGGASFSPQFMKRFIRNRLRSAYGLVAVHAGDIDQVHPLTLDRLYAQQNVVVDAPVDILILGVPNMSPYSMMSVFNPILLRSLVLGYMRGMYRGRPLVKEDGVIVACNPGLEKFHPEHHPAYIDFWNKDLENHMDPEFCWKELSEPYADNPVYLEKYRHHFAYHGTHGLINWMWSGMALKQVKGVILAGAKQPDVARKISFTPARNLDVAVDMAKEMTAKDAVIGYQIIPPLFSVDVGGQGH